MNDDEIQAYLERHTLIGASQRFEREVRDLGSAIMATRVGRIYYRLACFLLDHLQRLVQRLAR